MLAEKLFAGTYKSHLTSTREFVLQINKDLTYEYVEDSTNRGIIHQVIKKGNVKVLDRHTARLGRVRLNWISRHNIEVWSPYSATIGHGNNVNPFDGTGGEFMSAAEGHMFYLNKSRMTQEIGVSRIRCLC